MNFLKAIKKLFYYLINEKGNNHKEFVEEYEIQNPYVSQVKEWASSKIKSSQDKKNANAISAEFDEWINISNENEIEYIYLEDDQWTDEQEIDVR